MRSVRWLTIGLAAGAFACANPVTPTTDAEASQVHGLVSVARSVDATGEPRAEAIARFVRLPAFVETDVVLELAGMTTALPGLDGCTVPTAGTSAPFDSLGSVEFLPVGDVTVDTEGSVTSLAPHAFPGVNDVFSGIVYTSRDRSAEPLPAATGYSIRATGGPGIAPVHVATTAPAELEAVTVGGLPLAEVEAVRVGEPIDVTWSVGSAEDVVVLELSTFGGASVVCAFPDDRGVGTVPAGELAETGSGRLTVRRLRSAPFDGIGLDSGELRFDFALGATVEFRD